MSKQDQTNHYQGSSDDQSRQQGLISDQKEFQQLVKQQRTESLLDFTLIRDGRVNVNNYLYLQLLKQDMQALTAEQKKAIWDRTLEYLALLAMKQVFLKGDLASQVHIGKRNRKLIQLMPCYVAKYCPESEEVQIDSSQKTERRVKQLQQFADFLGITPPNQSLSYMEQILCVAPPNTAESVAQSTGVVIAKNLSELESAVLKFDRFIVFDGVLRSPPQLFRLLQTKAKETPSLGAALVARHMAHCRMLPFFADLSEELILLAEARDQNEFAKRLAAVTFADQFVQVPEHYRTRKVFRLVFGLTDQRIELKGNHCFPHDFCEEGRDAKVLNTASQLNAIYLKLNRASQKLPEVYRARILAFLQIFHHAVLEEGEDYGKMRVDGVVLYCPKGLADENVEAPKVEELKDFVNRMINPFL